MQTFINYARNLKFEEAPDYEYLKGILDSAKKRLGINYDYKYDWDKWFFFFNIKYFMERNAEGSLFRLNN